MSNKLIDLVAVEVELAALRATLIEMRTAVADSGSKSRVTVRRRIACLVAMTESSSVAG